LTRLWIVGIVIARSEATRRSRVVRHTTFSWIASLRSQ
jgi:hypothetical protein